MQNNENKSNELENQIENASQFEKESNDGQSNKKIRSKYLNEKTVTIVLTLAVVLIAVVSQKFLEAIEKEDYLKASDYVYYACSERREEVRKELQEEINKDDKRKRYVNKAIYRGAYTSFKGLMVEKTVEENGKEPYALLKEKPDSNRNRSGNWLLLKKVKNRWYVNLE